MLWEAKPGLCSPHMHSSKRFPAKRRGLPGTSQRTSAMLATATTHPKTRQRAAARCSGPAPPAASQFPLGRPRATCHFERKKGTTAGAGRLKAGSPSLESGSTTARMPQPLKKPPRAPLPEPETPLVPLGKNGFFVHFIVGFDPYKTSF